MFNLKTYIFRRNFGKLEKSSDTLKHVLRIIQQINTLFGWVGVGGGALALAVATFQSSFFWNCSLHCILNISTPRLLKYILD